ncbi:homocysteine-inducible, endoplasmic reticulum stress-inducible, ubiquitin-like domain member 1 [Chamberlinius hualienensis]
MNVLDLPIRLVVKAPNQQFDDQVIECAITWTVKKLKTYLSEVYPSKPNAEDQKLIYSGQLLPDNLMLKDILRQYDTEVVHTVHLVCMPPKDNVKSSSPSSLSSPSAATSPSTSSRSSRTDNSPTYNNSNNSSDGLRHRGTIAANNNTSNSEQTQHGQPVVETRPNSLPNSYGLTPEQLNQQLAWMRMYGQYMNYYMQQYQGVYGVNLPGVQPQAPISSPEVQPVADQANQNLENVRDRQNEIRRMNAQGGPVDDDDEMGGNRDWLDWVYVFSRLSVLFAIVYFYSSFNRFVMVVLFAVFLYIYQTGVFWRRDRLPRANNNNNQERNDHRVVENPPNENQNVQDQPQAQAEQELEQMQRETRELEETMDRDTEPNNRVTQQTVSFLHIAWTFVATFFSSLLPQQQEAANLN